MPKTEEGLSYQYENGVITFKTCPIQIRTLNIEKIDAGGPITEIRIEFSAFGAAGSRFFDVQELVLPNTLKVFPDFEVAFTKISQLFLPQTCQKFPKNAFSGWKRLKEIAVPNGVTELPDGVFSGCSSLQCVHLPDSVAAFGKEAFRNCSKLSGKWVLPKELTQIGDQAFLGCKSIEEIVFPENLISIGHKAFKGCAKLCRIDLSSSVRFQKDSFPEEARLVIDGLEQVAVPKEIFAKLSPVFLRDIDVQKIRASLQHRQKLEVHVIVHRFAKRLEVVTEDGAHVGFLADSAIKESRRLKKIQPGQAFDASAIVSDGGELIISFMDDVPFRKTSFPERTHCFDWNRPSFTRNQLPLEDAEFSLQVEALPYRFLCERDSLTQRAEYSRAFSEEAACIIYRKESESKYLYARSDKEISVFWQQNMSMTLLEHIPLGTQFEIRVESVRIQVDDDSWGAAHAGGMADYAYSVPAIVFFWKGVRVAYAPLLGRDLEWVEAILAFWKWSKNMSWKPKAWLVQITDTPACIFQLAFFEGNEQITGTIDLSEAMEYEGKQGEKVPLEKVFLFFSMADKICLCSQEAGSDGIALWQGDEIYRLPVGMYELCDLTEFETNYYKNRKWMAMEELENIVRSRAEWG